MSLCSALHFEVLSNAKHSCLQSVVVVVLVFVLSPAATLADDARRLEGKYIAEVGDLEYVECLLFGDYDCAVFPNNLYCFKYSQCFDIFGYYGGYSGDTALLAVDRNENVSMFIIEGRRINEYSITAYQCPTFF